MLNRGKTVENLINVRKSSYYNISIFAPLYIAVSPEGNQGIHYNNYNKWETLQSKTSQGFFLD